MPHLVLLGDSIFDNGAYTGGGPDVIAQVRPLLPAGWSATCLALDGATAADVPGQVRRLPGDASHLVLSVGGNDALQQLGVFDVKVRTVAQALGALADIAAQFERGYRRAVAACLGPRLPLAICTIYRGWFPDPDFQRLASTALTVFNDAIITVAIEYRLAVIDLRAICAKAEDYANPIEPSSVGGEKMARAIVAHVTGAGGPAARVIAG
jgi:hypothetical protein